MKGPPRMLNEKKEGVSVFSIVCGVLLAVIVAVFLFELWMVNHFVSVCIAGESMADTLHSGEWVYTRSDVAPERFDIITVDVRGYRDALGNPVFGDERHPVEFIVKRLIAVEGDAVKCEDGVVYLRYAGETEFTAIEEPYIRNACSDFDAVEVAEGQIFVMGDNRSESYDSRHENVGTLSFKDISGVVTQWSLEHKAFVTKWESFRDSLRTTLGKIFGKGIGG